MENTKIWISMQSSTKKIILLLRLTRPQRPQVLRNFDRRCGFLHEAFVAVNPIHQRNLHLRATQSPQSLV